MKYLLLVILVFLVACSSTKIIEKEVPIEKVKIEYINTLKIDSVYIHDSIDRFVNGDTLYLYKYKYIYKYLNHIDTVIQKDSIETPIYITKTEIKEVNKLKWYQKLLMWLGAAFVIGGIAITWYKLKKS